MIAPSLIAVVADEALHLPCTKVEIDVIGHLLTDGPANDVIARRMWRSEDTVKTHLRHIYTRSGVRSRVELAVKILREEILIIDPDGRRVRF